MDLSLHRLGPLMTEAITRSTAPTTPKTAEQPKGSKIFAVLTGITSVVVLLQAVWAGIFLEHDGARDAASNWVEIHARGGEVALGLAAIATIFAFVRLRSQKSLWIGSLALTVLLVSESYIGGLIVDYSQDSLTAVHVPLGMAIMGLVVWLPLRARRYRTAA